ncbi:MAG TPA: hypothetical protein VE642_03590 [Pyrinomonadaceae bacterium]|nr:hypothetical protein [Pyrinomonadaceae bacterium]
MTKWKSLSYSFSCATIVTSLAYLLYDAGGEYLLLPGITVELYLINPVVITISSGRLQLPIPVGNRFTFNVALYSLVFYVLLRLFARATVRREDSLPDAVA